MVKPCLTGIGTKRKIKHEISRGAHFKVPSQDHQAIPIGFALLHHYVIIKKMSSKTSRIVQNNAYAISPYP